MLGDKGRWFKGLQYEGSAHVPLLWKGQKGAVENGGRAIDKVIENTDLMPSILEAAGLPVPEGLQGRSFLKLARGQDSNWKGTCYSELRSGMFLNGQWKFIDNSLDGTGVKELYDLRNDPKEERNLAGESRQRERVRESGERLNSWRADRPAPLRISGMSTPQYAQVPDAERNEAIRAAPDNVEGRNEKRTSRRK